MTKLRSALASTIRQNIGFYIAIAMLAALYLVYNFMHPRGFSAAVLIQNSNESVAIVFLAMAQTVPVLLGGLDLSCLQSLLSSLAAHEFWAVKAGISER